MWYAQLLDPFEFIPDVKSEVERLKDEEAPAEERSFRLPIAGDYLHKNDVSGGAATVVPCDEADARVVEDDGVWFKCYTESLRELVAEPSTTVAATPQRHDEPIWLVDYLRMYFEAGGFRRVVGTESYPEGLLRQMTPSRPDHRTAWRDTWHCAETASLL